MGVLGLTPFLQKNYPEVIKKLPDRLRSFRGKTIVIDGTLVTQRFHFASMPWDHRHVLGWYKIIQELKDSGVSAICVFDGQERNKAKAREAARRKEARNLAVARGSIEVERLKRLRKLVGLVEECARRGEKERGSVSAALRGVVLGGRKEHAGVGAGEVVEGKDKTIDERSQLQDVSSLEEVDPTTQSLLPHPADLHEILLDRIGQSIAASQISYLSTIYDYDYDFDYHVNYGLRDQVDVDDAVSVIPEVEELRISSSPSPPESMPPPSESQTIDSDIPSALVSLYLEYCQSIPKLTSLSPKSPSLSSSAAAAQDEQGPITDQDQEQEQAEYAMSKQQLQLTVDEGKVWDDLVVDKPTSKLRKSIFPVVELPKEIKPSLSPPQTDTAQATLISLAEKSSSISESYERRNNPPTAQTFEESKEIILALGVPCLDSTGAYEAEALAASLVINGHADYVASEDTDVLVYEAPLIRNITSRVEPLTIVSGSDIRTVLDLSRASFVDFALLLGTDFSQRIKNIGPQRALKFIRLYGSIEAIIQQERKYSPRLPEKAYLEQVEAARGVFRTLPEVPDLSLLKARESDTEAVWAILQKYGVHRASGFKWDYDAALEGNYFEDNPSAL